MHCSVKFNIYCLLELFLTVLEYRRHDLEIKKLPLYQDKKGNYQMKHEK